jgi:prefoldin beta subunit
MDQDKLQQMQFLEQNLQAVLMQKQAFQMEQTETFASLKEVEKSSDTIYKVVGQLMISTSKEKVIEELKNKEKLVQLRLKSLDKQEEEIQKQVKKVRSEILKK